MKSTFVATICGLILATQPALCQSTIKIEGQPSTTSRASDLIGATILRGKSTVGRVSDFTLNDQGAVHDLIVRTDSNVLFALSFSAVRYDKEQKAYVISGDVPPRFLGKAKEPAAAPLTTTTDRPARTGRLVRDNGSARIERETPAYVSPTRDALDIQYRAMAAAARVYNEPIGSVSLTRNVFRLPSRGEAYDNQTLYSEMTGRRSFFKVPPPPVYAR